MGLGDVGVMETAAVFPLTKRKRFLIVKHVQLTPPCENEGRQTSIDSLPLTKLSAQALNLEKSGSSASTDSKPWNRSDARNDALQNNKWSGPGLKLAGFAKSTMNVGRSSCSISSTTPTP